ncbi:hypothetical protein SARC_00605 [Sphaeroforma arctica JP610]|uniref:Uncharacterized protein n=1 Tax=Sphaeroforma arctica JP610 TaxID=667725 RepID=A0A0L0GE23_9EUKA|nr:hypothetical protein SARC_00605 [Sphaeroforma arctica JP610]KNC87277.1 hypothetical protein SARC_00605 [Sphaeroforma arctica JP610]|eukprot:XP_014161179.1 hypothetical protein SARC_00605 [Sphaeroforma arctica JP610]
MPPIEMIGPVDDLYERICNRLRYGRDALMARHAYLRNELKPMMAQMVCVDAGIYVKIVACTNIKRNLEDQATLVPVMKEFGDMLHLIHTEPDCVHDVCMEVVVTTLTTPLSIPPDTPPPVTIALSDDAVTEPTTTTSSPSSSSTTAPPIPDTPLPVTVALSDDAMTGTTLIPQPPILKTSVLSGLSNVTVTRKRKERMGYAGEYRRDSYCREREYLSSNPKRTDCSVLVSSIGLYRTSGQSVVYKLQKLINEKPWLFSGLDVKHEEGELKKELTVIIHEYYNRRTRKYNLEHKSPLCKALFVKFLIRDCNGSLVEMMAFKTLFDECWISNNALTNNNNIGV